MTTETRTFKKAKSHKHTTSFEEVAPPGKPPIVGTVYVQTWFVGDAIEISITVGPVKP